MKKLKVIFCLLLLTVVISLNVQVRAAEQLPDDGAKISSAQIIQTKTGTGPWDENDEPGNDSSEDNNIVRSFDKVTWTIENTFTLNNADAQSYSGGRIYFEAKLPNVFNKETIRWSLNDMGWIENPQVSSDGLTLTGYYQMSSENITIPGKQTLVFIAEVLGQKNGVTFKPEFNIWLNGNSTSDYKKIIGDELVVSAAPRYNVVLKRNTEWDERVSVNYDGEDLTGRMYGYYVILQLVNNDPSKGLRGLENPEGQISFDVNLEFTKSRLGESTLTDITNDADIRLWNYKVSSGSNTGVIANRIMRFHSSSGHGTGNWLAPSGKRGSVLNAVCDSGNVNILKQGNSLKFTINDYKFDGTFPVYNASYTDGAYIYNSSVGCFGSYYFQLLVPDNEATEEGNYNYYLKLSDNNFNTHSISGDEVTQQTITTDDTVSVTYVRYKPGSYEQEMWAYNGDNGTRLSTHYNRADGYVAQGQNINISIGMRIGQTNESEVNTVDKLFKFDGIAFEPRQVNGDYFYTQAMVKPMTFKMWFVTKPDGSNWASQAEMNAGKIENLNIYETLDDVPEGYVVVGEYFESQNGPLPIPTAFETQQIRAYLKATDEAIIGQTYGFVQNSRYWLDELDRSQYSQTILNGYGDYPTQIWRAEGRNYIKTEYDNNGSQISGTHSGGYVYGTSLLIVGAKQGISTTTVDDSGAKKTVFDIGKNENKVNYVITPTLKSQLPNLVISDVTLTLTDTLPKGLKYIANSSNYGEPDITENADGSSTLVWKINGCTVDQAIEPLKFSASINEESANGVQYVNKVVVTGDEKIGNTALINRTSEYSIQIVNLASHRLYKTVETPVIEENGNIHFTLSYKNNTDGTIPNFQLLDILPYNGDGRGTNYTGTYVVDKLIVTQYDANGTVISNNNLNIAYTNDENVRENVTCKDTNLANGWIALSSQNLSQPATAFAVIGPIGEQASVKVDIYLKTNENKGLDKYVNNATAQVYTETEEMVTSNVTTQVVLRTIEGIAWKDANANGIKDANEEIFKNVAVTLTDANGAQVTDVDGHPVTTINTDDNGYYKFTNLPMSNYLVKVTAADDTYMLTEKEVGSNTTINSKFNVESATTDEITKLNSIDLPELTQSNVNAGFVKKPTKVIVNYICKLYRKRNNNKITSRIYNRWKNR